MLLIFKNEYFQIWLFNNTYFIILYILQNLNFN